MLGDVGGEAFAGAGKLDHFGDVTRAGGDGAVDVAVLGVLELEDENGAGDLVVEDAGVWVRVAVGKFHVQDTDGTPSMPAALTRAPSRVASGRRKRRASSR